MTNVTTNPPNFSITPSRPRARRLARIAIYLLLLALASAAIWWIDRGAMLTNIHPKITPSTSPQIQ
jgi:hypothetical protein